MLWFFKALICAMFDHKWEARVRLEPKTNVIVAYYACARCGVEVGEAKNNEW